MKIVFEDARKAGGIYWRRPVKAGSLVGTTERLHIHIYRKGRYWEGLVRDTGNDVLCGQYGFPTRSEGVADISNWLRLGCYEGRAAERAGK